MAALLQVGLGALALLVHAFAPHLRLRSVGTTLSIVGALVFVLVRVLN